MKLLLAAILSLAALSAHAQAPAPGPHPYHVGNRILGVFEGCLVATAQDKTFMNHFTDLQTGVQAAGDVCADLAVKRTQQVFEGRISLDKPTVDLLVQSMEQFEIRVLTNLQKQGKSL